MTDHSLRVVQRPAPLRQKVVDVLRGAIVEGRYRPGDRLVERDLCEATGVSRTLVREALRQLEAESLVTVIPNKGPVVSTIAPPEAREIYQVRAVLEALACKLAARNGSAERKRQLQEQFRLFAAACMADDAAEAVRAKASCYAVLFDCSGNEVLKSQLELVFARTSLLRARTLAMPGRLHNSRKEIGEIVKAIEEGDGERAWEASIRHVEAAAAVLEASYAATTAAPVRRVSK